MNYDYESNKASLVDSTGRRLTTGLFEELSPSDATVKPVFKLTEWKATYVEIADPTDYLAAAKLLGDWDHWKMLVANPVFKAHLDEWRKEVEVKLKSLAIGELIRQAKLPTGTSAAKYLVEHNYDKKSKGTPKSKQSDRSASDAARIGMALVK